MIQGQGIEREVAGRSRHGFCRYQLAIAIAHGRRTLNVIRFNIGFALLTKAIFIVLGATLLVIANSLRLLRMGDEA